MSHEDMTMILLDVLTGAENVPVIVSDLRAEILEARQLNIDLRGLEDLDKTDLFTLLNILKTEGLVERLPEGYVVSDTGRTRARQLLDHEQMPTIDRLNEAAQAALSRAS